MIASNKHKFEYPDIELNTIIIITIFQFLSSYYYLYIYDDCSISNGSVITFSFIQAAVDKNLIDISYNRLLVFTFIKHAF